MSTDLTSEFTHFNLVIRLSKVQQSALRFVNLFRYPAVPAVQGIPVICFSLNVRSFGTTRNSFFATAAWAFEVQHDTCDYRQQACPFPAGMVSLVSGEVKHVVHLIRWNLKAVLCQLGQDLTTVPVQGIIARPLDLGTESCLLFGFIFIN